MRRKIAGIILFCVLALSSFAQKAILRGNVVDEKSGETIVGASVILDGTMMGAMTDFDGNYEIKNIPEGTYTIKCSFISYQPQMKEVALKANQASTHDFKLSEAVVEVEEVKVVARVNRESENLLLLEQKNAVLAQQAIGAQEISRKGASDAESAVTKVSGISKQEGVKNVFVRGLGDRFNSTTLNGFPVTSEDPEYKNISLDFFSSDIIKAIGIKKVFNAVSSGDVGGAEIDISSKELVGDGEFSIDASAKANNRSLNVDFLIPDGVSNLGFGRNTNSPTSEESYLFQNSLDPTAQNFQLGKGFGFSGGKRFEINKKPLTLYIIGNYSNDYSYTDGTTRETTTNGTIFRNQNTKEYDRKSSHLGMANLNYELSRKSSLSYNLLAIHTAKEGLRDDYGQNSEVFQESVDNIGLVRRQQNNLNTLVVNQLMFRKEINKRLSGNAGIAYNFTNGKEPDRRVNYLTYEGDSILSPLRGSGRQHRYFSDLKENDINVIVRARYKLTNDDNNISAVEVGYKGRLLHDNFNSNSWDNSRTQSKLPELDMNNFSLDAIFNQEEFDAKHFKNDEYNVSNYTVFKLINSVFSELDYQLSEEFIANFGLKADIINLNVDFDVNDGSKRDSHKLNRFYILPDLNLKYTLNEKNNIRFGGSRTYTLPQSKEISPLLYEGPQWSSQGNPDLVPSVNYNLDLKWDFYPTNGELISLTAFGKLIQNPLSKVEVNSAGGFLSYANIADKATLAGVEVEIRKNIFSVSNTESNITNKLSTGINFSYISTGIKTESKVGSSIPLNFTNEETQLEGASPIIANGDLSYNYRKNDFEVTASAVANYVSKHIYSIGVNGFNDINESSRTTLDFVSSVKFNKHWGLSIKAKNLLDPEFQLTREPSVEGADEVVLKSYKKGISVSCGLSYHF